MLEMSVNAKVEDVVDLFVENGLRQAKRRYLRKHKAAAFELLVEEMDLVAKRCKIARNGQRGRTGTDQGDLLTVRRKRCLRHQMPDLVAIIRGDALQTADCDRFFIDTAASARRFTRAVTRSAQYSGKHVRVPIDHIGLGVAAFRDQTDILRHGRMRRTRVLAVNDFVEVFRVGDVRGLQGKSFLASG